MQQDLQKNGNLSEAKYSGSSITRTVNDMFDSSVILDGIELIPKSLWTKSMSSEVVEGNDDHTSTSSTDIHRGVNHKLDMNGNAIKMEEEDNHKQESPPPPPPKTKKLLLQSFMDQLSQSIQSNQKKAIDIKQTHGMQFEDMIPKSLCMSLPDSYTDQLKGYYQKVKEREEAIRKFQKQQHAKEDAMDAYEDLKEEWKYKQEEHEWKKRKAAERVTAKVKQSDASKLNENDKDGNDNLDKKEKENANGNDFQIDAQTDCKMENNTEKELLLKHDEKENDEEFPPMPSPPILPTPVEVPPIPIRPRLTPDLESIDNRLVRNDDEHKTNTLGIERQSCIPERKMHLVEHLDPACFLPGDGRYYGLMSNSFADPQFLGPNAPGIGNSNNHNGASLATAYTGAAGITERLSTIGALKITLNSNSSNINIKKKESATPSQNNKNTSTLNSKSKSSASSMVKGKTNIPPTSTSMQLKKLMEKGGEEAAAMRDSIIRAAVYASRTGNHGGSFVGANGDTYPDVIKAFSNQAQLRPCTRCKNNKQGSYHCRLRRKHQELDFDGGNSADVLRPLFALPIENLLVKPLKD